MTMRSHTVLLATSAALFLDLASAHGFVTGVKVNDGTWFPGADPVWYYYQPGTSPPTTGWNSLNQDLGFVAPSEFGSSDIACHKSATPGKLYINANAGDTLNIYWYTWPGDSHKGPVINYLAECDGECTSISPSSLSFTKIDEQGYTPESGWVTDQIIAAKNFSTTVRIPPKLRPGNYVLRHEIIALHGAWGDNGAQNYPQCLNLKIGGSGSVNLPSGTLGTALYQRNEPGILFNIWNEFESYPIPGPQLWTGAN